MHSGLEAYRKSLRSNPGAFIEGARAFCKMAAENGYAVGDGPEGYDDEKSLWDRVKPWLLGLGIGYAGLSAGSMWGRHAEKTNDNGGPVLGPLRWLAGKISRDIRENGGQGK